MSKAFNNKTKLNDMVSVKDFGAVGDGVADDTTAITSAHATGRPVFYPYGTYKFVGYFPDCEGGIIGEGWSTNNNAKNTKIVFYECTNPQKGAITLKQTTPYSRFFRIENIMILASSWDLTTGCLGYGLDIGTPITMTYVYVGNFKKSGIFLHHVWPVAGSYVDGPYESILTQVTSAFNGQHGCLIGHGANTLTLINYAGKWSGSPSYGVAPSVAGSYDGLHVNATADGNDITAYTPEGLTIIGGDCSYNARYGWNFVAVTNSPAIMPTYAEYNLASGGYQAALGNGVSGCTINFANVDSSELTQTPYAEYAPSNNIYTNGKLIGYGDDSYIIANAKNQYLTTFGAVGGSVFIRPDSSGSRISRFGSGSSDSYFTLGGNTSNEVICFTNDTLSLPRFSYVASSDATAISGVANNGSGLIRVTTASAHGLSSGERVQMFGASGVPNTSGYITVINTTTFDIVGSSFAGTYVSGGAFRTILRRGYATAAPSSQGVLGDIVWNVTPSAGGFMGWTCVTTGNPGTWKSFGEISA